MLGALIMDKLFGVNTLTCTVLCCVHGIVNVMMILWLTKNIISKQQLKICIYAVLYAYAMSIPVMPFILDPKETLKFPVLIITIFSFFVLWWQYLFFTVHYMFDFRKLMIPVSLSCLSAWVAMVVTNVFGYYYIACLFSYLF